MTQSSRNRLALILISLAALFTIAADGSVISLSVSGGSGYDETITINSTIQADSKVNNSNLYFEIRAEDGTVVATHSVSPPSLQAGETYSYSWTSNNSSYPTMGNYSVSLCWSPGNSSNCGVVGSPITTTFYSVPAFGEILTAVGLLLVGVWFWHMRRKLMKAHGAEA